ncbi:MAG: hypothetical protein K2L97_04525 [Muribaculaceae bacterium]|nr:hypothetical protein [Muribaculaceae bacterium]
MKKLSISCLLLTALCWLMPSGTVSAQNAEISPYSRFGYGMLNDHANASQRGMGGVGLASRSGQYINFMNPASYAAIDSVTFLFDIAASAKTLSTNETVNGVKKSGKDFTGGLDYVALQFPMTRYGGMAIGLVPYSEVGYKFGNQIANGTNEHQGSGTLNELFVGLSAKPFKGFSLGLNFSYLFGTLLNDTYIYSASSTSLFEQVTEVRDYTLRLGVQYGFDVNKDNRVTVGAIYSPRKSFHGHAYGVKYEIGQDTANDTIGYGPMKGHYGMPDTWGAGVSWCWRNSLTVEADFTYEAWKDVKYRYIEGFANAGTTRFDNRWKAAVGAEYVPALRGSYMRRVHYRVGGYYTNDYIMVGNNSVKEYGVTVGLGLPAPSTKTMINFSAEYRHRAASPAALVTENYFQFTIGVNVNELWFWRNKLR